jgi:hypothetical protein
MPILFDIVAIFVSHRGNQIFHPPVPPVWCIQKLHSNYDQLSLHLISLFYLILKHLKQKKPPRLRNIKDKEVNILKHRKRNTY